MEWAAADFETTTIAEDCRVWAWAVAPVGGGETVYGNSIDTFLLYMAGHADVTFWFHNLAFDGRFITDRLLRLGYVWVAAEPMAGQFTTLVSSTGKFYSMTIAFYNGRTAEVRDSLKVFPMSVANVAKAFNLPEGKGELDYETVRPVGHELTPMEIDYIRRDVEIMAAALKSNMDEGLTKMTVGSNAFGYFKEQTGKKAFRTLFPTISMQADEDIRRSYRGGFTYVNPRFKGVDVYGGISVDYNSMYPSMMISKWYPVGKPHPYAGAFGPIVSGYPAFDPGRELYVQRMTVTFALKPDGIPMVQLRSNGLFGMHEYVRECPEPVQITLTCVDCALFFGNYDVEVWSWDGGYSFRTAHGSRLFGEYVEHWGSIKRASKGPKRQIAKLMLNNIYGKFATNPDVTPKVPVMDEGGTVRWVLGPAETRDPVYLPVGAFCTAWARHTLISAIHANQDRFIYCDTDSMHLAGTDDPEGIPLHDTNLCAWKVEGTFSHARHLRAKCYIWDLNGEVSVTCAGMPSNVKALCTFENFHFGLSNVDPLTGKVIEGAGKLTPVSVPGGVVLEPRVYELHE